MKTRGIRNNNPFNIKKSNNHWIGKIKGDDKVFETFDTLLHGYRAGLIILKTYYNKYNCCTVKSVIERFAPSSENDVSKYIEFICNRTLLLPREKISLEDLLICVAPQITYFESLFIPEVHFRTTQLSILYKSVLNK